MFAAMKENAAKRKAARKANTERFRARMAEINEKAELDKLSLEAARLANLETFKAKMRDNNATFKKAWSNAE